MGLFSSKSKSSSSTQYVDNSANLNQSTGDFLASDKNNIAGGDIYNTGLSEDMVSNIFLGVNEQIETILQNADKIYSGALSFVSETASNQAATLSQAYNSEASSLSGLKSYAVYGLIGFIAWAYFSKMR